MINDAGPFPPDYNPNQDVERILKSGNESRREEVEAHTRVIEMANAEVVMFNEIRETVGTSYQTSNSAIDQDALSSIYHFVENQVDLADGLRRYYGKLRDHETHGGEIDLTPEATEQRDAVITGLWFLANYALDPDTRGVLNEAIYKLGGKPEES